MGGSMQAPPPLRGPMLSQLREDLGFSRLQVARALGCDPRYVMEVETNRRPADADRSAVEAAMARMTVGLARRLQDVFDPHETFGHSPLDDLCHAASCGVTIAQLDAVEAGTGMLSPNQVRRVADVVRAWGERGVHSLIQQLINFRGAQGEVLIEPAALAEATERKVPKSFTIRPWDMAAADWRSLVFTSVEALDDLLDRAQALRGRVGLSPLTTVSPRPLTPDLVREAVDLLLRGSALAQDPVGRGWPIEVPVPISLAWLVANATLLPAGQSAQRTLDRLGISRHIFHASIIDEAAGLGIPLTRPNLDQWLEGSVILHPLIEAALVRWVEDKAQRPPRLSGARLHSLMQTTCLGADALCATVAAIDPQLRWNKHAIQNEWHDDAFSRWGGLPARARQLLDTVLIDLAERDAVDPLPTRASVAAELEQMGATRLELIHTVERQLGPQARSRAKNLVTRLLDGVYESPGREGLAIIRRGLRAMREDRAREVLWNEVDPLRDGAWLRATCEPMGLSGREVMGLVDPPPKTVLAAWRAIPSLYTNEVDLGDRRRIQNAVRAYCDESLPAVTIGPDLAAAQADLAARVENVLDRADVPLQVLIDRVASCSAAEHGEAVAAAIRRLLLWPRSVEHPVAEDVAAALRQLELELEQHSQHVHCLARLAAADITEGELAVALGVPAELVVRAADSPELLTREDLAQLDQAGSAFTYASVGATAEAVRAWLEAHPGATEQGVVSMASVTRQNWTTVTISRVRALLEGRPTPLEARVCVSRGLRAPRRAEVTRDWVQAHTVASNAAASGMATL